MVSFCPIYYETSVILKFIEFKVFPISFKRLSKISWAFYLRVPHFAAKDWFLKRNSPQNSFRMGENGKKNLDKWCLEISFQKCFGHSLFSITLLSAYWSWKVLKRTFYLKLHLRKSVTYLQFSFWNWWSNLKICSFEKCKDFFRL